MAPEGWSAVTLKPHLDLLSGYAFPSEHFTEDPAGPPLVRIRDLELGNSETYYSGEYEDRFIIPSGSILVGMDGDFSAVRWEQTGCLLNQRVLRVASASPTVLDEAFLFYRLNKELPELQRIIGGTTVKHLSQKHLKKLRVPLPPLPEQRKIATILSSVDEAITATWKVIEQTKRVKKGLLQTLITRGIGHTRFKKTEIGEIPEEWDVTKVCEIADVGYGVTVNQQRRESTDRVPLLTVAAHDPDQGWRNEGVSEIGVLPGDREKYSAEDGDVLLVEGNGNPDLLGRPLLWDARISGALHQNHLIRVRSQEVEPEWLVLALSSLAARRQIEANAKSSSGLYTINSSVVKNTLLPLPTVVERREILSATISHEGAIRRNSATLAALEQLKRGLMQDLLTGRVRVPLD